MLGKKAKSRIVAVMGKTRKESCDLSNFFLLSDFIMGNIIVITSGWGHITFKANWTFSISLEKWAELPLSWAKYKISFLQTFHARGFLRHTRYLWIPDVVVYANTVR